MHNPLGSFPFRGAASVEHERPLGADKARTRLHVALLPSSFPVAQLGRPPTLRAVRVLPPPGGEEEPLALGRYHGFR